MASFVRIACLIPVFVASALRAAEPIQIAADLSMVLAPNWKVLSRNLDPVVPPGLRSTESGSGTLLLSASPVEASRHVVVSVFRLNSHAYGPPVWAGNLGVEAETEKLLTTVLGLGFNPSATKVTRSTSGPGLPTVTIQITGKDGNALERVFSMTVTARPTETVRMSMSYGANDLQSARDLETMIQSLSSGGGVTARGTAQGGTAKNGTVPGGTAPGGEMFGVPVTGTPGATLNPPGGSPANPVAGSTVLPPATTVPVPISDETAVIVRDFNDALVIVEGKKGVGSGFLCKVDGQTFILTNAHVLSDNSGLKFTTLGGTALVPAASAIAVGIDAVRLAVAGAPKAFALMDNIESTAKIGDRVTVLGNAEGARVVKPCEGRIVGIGPDLVEVDAAFVPGNSGSPIIHLATGKVLGIATYLVQRKISDPATGAVSVQTRRFGYRLGTVKRWEPINWTRFFAQSTQVAKIEALSDEFVKMGEDARQDRRLEASRYQSAALNKAISNFTDTSRRLNRMSPADRKELLKRFFGDLRTATRSDISAFDAVNAYDFFRRSVEEHSKFRDELYASFTQVIEKQAN